MLVDATRCRPQARYRHRPRKQWHHQRPHPPCQQHQRKAAEYGPLGLHIKSFYLFVLWCAHDTSLCCRGASQPSSALGPLMMGCGAPLRAEAKQGLPALAQYDLWHSVVIGGIPNVSAPPLNTRDVRRRRMSGVDRKGLFKARDYAPCLPDLYQSLKQF